MQKRGVIVDADDFSHVTATYPQHPNHSHIPQHKTKKELQEGRLRDNSDVIAQQKVKWEQANPQYVENKQYANEFQVSKPKNTSIKLIKA